MKFGSRRATLCAVATTCAWLLTVALVSGQAAQNTPVMSEQAFKNIQVLRGIPVNDFLMTMGVFSASLGISCEDCHGAATTWEGYAVDEGFPLKQMTRRMVLMMQAINRANFGGQQLVTCYACHRGATRPKATSDLAAQYGPPTPDPNDTFEQARFGVPTVDEILDKFVQAAGGQQRIAALTGFVGKGESLGYGPEGNRPVEVFAQATGKRTTVLHTDNGESTWVINGQQGWYAGALGAVPVIEFVNQDLEGALFEAAMSFPDAAQIKQSLRDIRVGFPSFIDDREIQRVQGFTPGGAIITMYFDSETGLLRRLVRYAESPVGRLTWQYDYEDYRAVAGVQVPHKLTWTFLNGREFITLTDVQAATSIPASRFARPAGRAR